MIKYLSGRDLAGPIKIRHEQEVSELLAQGIKPKLAIIKVNNDPVINTYVGLKQKYGADIGAEVEVHTPEQSGVANLLEKLNGDDSVSAIIVQLPLPDTTQTEELVNLVAPQKDVDALGKNSSFTPATPMAILWLFSGYDIDLTDKKVLLIGRGKLVGAPLERLLEEQGVDLEVVSKPVLDLGLFTKKAEVIIGAAGAAGIISSDMIEPGTLIVDAATSNENGQIMGNVKPEVYERDDITITPVKGGVGPLTVCALFENVIKAAQRLAAA